MSRYFEVFDERGELVSTEWFFTPDGAQQHADALIARGDENGPLHVGHACPDHDEHENVNCRYCKLAQVPFVPCDHCGLNASHDRDCPNAPRVSRLETEYVPALWSGFVKYGR